MYVNPLVEGTGPIAPIPTDVYSGEFSLPCESLHRLWVQSKQLSGLLIGQEWFKVFGCHKIKGQRGCWPSPSVAMKGIVLGGFE